MFVERFDCFWFFFSLFFDTRIDIRCNWWYKKKKKTKFCWFFECRTRSIRNFEKIVFKDSWNKFFLKRKKFVYTNFLHTLNYISVYVICIFRKKKKIIYLTSNYFATRIINSILLFTWVTKLFNFRTINLYKFMQTERNGSRNGKERITVCLQIYEGKINISLYVLFIMEHLVFFPRQCKQDTTKHLPFIVSRGRAR